MKALGIDLGTTTISAVVMEEDSWGRERPAKGREHVLTVENDSFLPGGHTWESLQNPAVIIEKAREILDRLLALHKDVGRIGLTGQMHGMVYIDQLGKAVSPLYTWQDGRGNDRRFGGRNICEILEQEYGVKAHSGYGLITHLYNHMTGQVPEAAAGICTVMDYFGMVLTGRKRPLVHVSNGASLGLYEERGQCFLKKVWQGWGQDEGLLPEITEDLEMLGTYQGIPVCVAIGDNQASFLGSVRDRESSVLVNIGTGSQVSVCSEHYLQAEGMETRPFLKGSYLLAGSALCGGRAYELLERFFCRYGEALGVKDADHYEVMDKLLSRGIGQRERLAVITRFAGTRDHPQLRGSIGNIGIDNFLPETLILGVREGMAQELYDLYQRIEGQGEPPRTRLVASGNGVRQNIHLQKILEQRFGMELQLAEWEEEAACGAALAGMMGTSSR